MDALSSWALLLHTFRFRFVSLDLILNWLFRYVLPLSMRIISMIVRWFHRL